MINTHPLPRAARQKNTHVALMKKSIFQNIMVDNSPRDQIWLNSGEKNSTFKNTFKIFNLTVTKLASHNAQ